MNGLASQWHASAPVEGTYNILEGGGEGAMRGDGEGNTEKGMVEK